MATNLTREDIDEEFTFRGLRNVHWPKRLEKGSLREAENFYLDDTEALETIPGFIQDDANVDAVHTDAWEMDHLHYGFFVANGSIYARFENGLTTPIVHGLMDSVMQWTSVGDNCWFAGAYDAGWIVNGTEYRPLRLPMPIAPAVAVNKGKMNAGQYQVTQLFEDIISGLQSPCAPSLNINLLDDSSLLVMPSPPVGYQSHVYVSSANHTVLRYLGTSIGGWLNYDGQDLGAPTDKRQINTYPFPDGPIAGLAWHDEKLFVAVHDARRNVSTVFLSQRQAYGCYDLEADAFAVSGKIYQIISVGEGVLIATDRSIVLRQNNDTNQGQLNKLANYGCISGRPMAKDQYGNVSIATLRGAAMYSNGNLVSSHMKYSWPASSDCASAIVNVNGATLAIVLTGGGGIPFNEFPLDPEEEEIADGGGARQDSEDASIDGGNAFVDN